MPAEFLTDFFKDEEVFVVASGPSLTGFDFTRLKSKKVVAINRAAEHVKPDLAVYVDRSMRQFFLDLKLDCPVLTSNFAGVPPGHFSVWVDLWKIPGPEYNNVSQLYGFCSSTAVGISAALVAGAKTVYVLGLDLYGGYFYGDSTPQKRQLENQRKFFLKFWSYSKTDRVINLNPESRVNVFKKQLVNEVI